MSIQYLKIVKITLKWQVDGNDIILKLKSEMRDYKRNIIVDKYTWYYM
jgi:hypothetical protein